VVTRLSAKQVGREGRVVGLDINPGMLDVARSVTPAELGIEWQHADAEDLPFPGQAFDAVLCQLSLQFLPKPVQALREMHRVLADAGRLVLNVPGPADPIFETLADAMQHRVAPEAANFVRTVFSLHDESEVEHLLEGAGFHDVDTRAYTRELPLPGAREFLWQYVGSTPLAGLVARADQETRAALEADVLAGWARHEQGDHLRYQQRIVMASAQR
jgi:SAM-dependent methyltransferase